MKKGIFLLFAFTIAFLSACAQVQPTKTTLYINTPQETSTVAPVIMPSIKDPESTMESIKYNRNASIKSYQVVEKDMSSLVASTQGSIAQGYYDNSKLVMLVVTIYGEMGRLIYEFFPMTNDVYAVKNNINYNESIYMNSQPEEHTESLIKAIIHSNRTYYIISDDESLFLAKTNDFLDMYNLALKQFNEQKTPNPAFTPLPTPSSTITPNMIQSTDTRDFHPVWIRGYGIVGGSFKGKFFRLQDFLVNGIDMNTDDGRQYLYDVSRSDDNQTPSVALCRQGQSFTLYNKKGLIDKENAKNISFFINDGASMSPSLDVDFSNEKACDFAVAGPWNALPNVPVYQTKGFDVDLDHDGIIEKVYYETLTQTIKGNVPAMRVVMEKKGKKTTIYSVLPYFEPDQKTATKDFITLKLSCADLNGDGNMEVIVEETQFELNGIKVFSQVNQKWTDVMNWFWYV